MQQRAAVSSWQPWHPDMGGAARGEMSGLLALPALLITGGVELAVVLSCPE